MPTTSKSAGRGSLDIVRHRLHNQRLAQSRFQNPADVVSWLGAVQSQDYPAAKWGIGLRAPTLTDADVERAFNEGSILRTHILRPTWHFVTPADIRWMLMLIGPRVQRMCGHYYRKLGVADGLTRGRAVIEQALEGGRQLTRNELRAALTRARIPADGLRLVFLLLYAELEGAICSGPKRGNQFTYALLDERVPRAKPMTRDEALAELTRRYFTSHGPATVRDFTWWSGLTVAEVKTALELLNGELQQHVADGKRFWYTHATSRASRSAPSAHLLPNYDEYLVAYKDRELVVMSGKDLFAHYVIIDGRLAGTWKAKEKGNSVVLELAPYTRPTRVNTQALRAAADRYSRFIGARITIA